MQTATVETFEPAGTPAPVILGYRCDCPAIQAVIGSPEETPGAGGVSNHRSRIDVKLTTREPQFAHGTSLFVQYQYAGRDGELHVPVRWLLRSVYELMPPRAFFGQIQNTDEPVSQTVSLKRLDGKRFKIERAESTHEAARCSAGSGESDCLRVHVTLMPAKVRGFCHGEIVVTTDQTDQPVIKVPFAGYCLESP